MLAVFGYQGALLQSCEGLSESSAEGAATAILFPLRSCAGVPAAGDRDTETHLRDLAATAEGRAKLCGAFGVASDDEVLVKVEERARALSYVSVSRYRNHANFGC